MGGEDLLAVFRQEEAVAGPRPAHERLFYCSLRSRAPVSRHLIPVLPPIVFALPMCVS